MALAIVPSPPPTSTRDVTPVNTSLHWRTTTSAKKRLADDDIRQKAAVGRHRLVEKLAILHVCAHYTIEAPALCHSERRLYLGAILLLLEPLCQALRRFQMERGVGQEDVQRQATCVATSFVVAAARDDEKARHRCEAVARACSFPTCSSMKIPDTVRNLDKFMFNLIHKNVLIKMIMISYMCLFR
jgi:hypothetical protein